MWIQRYDPLGAWPLSTLVAALPVLVLLGLLASGKASAWASALAGLATAAVAAIFVFGMDAGMVALAATHGVAFAAFRIIWLIVAAVFLYDIAVATGQFEVMKASIARLSGDRGSAGGARRLLVRPPFLKARGRVRGAGGHFSGVPGRARLPAVPGCAPLPDRQYRPRGLQGRCIGTPIRALAEITGLDVEALSVTSGRILPPLALLLPFWLVRTMTGWRETFAIWPALLAIGGAFATTQFVWSNFVGFELVDLVSAIASLATGVVILKLWRPKVEWRFQDDDLAEASRRR